MDGFLFIDDLWKIIKCFLISDYRKYFKEICDIVYRPYIHSDHDRRNFVYLVIKVKENRKFTEILEDKVIRKMVKEAMKKAIELFY